jgi:hypothetical protein
MDQIFIKTQNPKCRLFWCLIEFIDWSQSCWYFRPFLSPSGSSTPLPCGNKYSGIYSFIQCVMGGGDRGPQTDNHLPPSTFTGQFLNKADT